MDGGPCLFCAACGSWCTTKPRNLTVRCNGRSGREAAGLAALKSFRQGYVPDSGEPRARRVHGVQPLHAGAVDLWASVPLPKCIVPNVQPAMERDVALARPSAMGQQCFGTNAAEIVETRFLFYVKRPLTFSKCSRQC